MTDQRLVYEIKILEQYYPGQYEIEKLPNNEYTIACKHADLKYSIELKEYPDRIPKIKLDFVEKNRSAFDPETGTFILDEEIREVEGVLFVACFAK